MHRLRTREAFHAAGHGSGRRLVSEMQRRLASGMLAHYAAYSTQRSSACWTTNFVASELLPLQVCSDWKARPLLHPRYGCERSNDAILWLRSKMIARLELPAAREYEAKLKAEKEKKARESVPSSNECLKGQLANAFEV